MKWTSNSPEQTQQIAHDILKRFPNHSMWCLYGDLGSGKTAFTKGAGESLGINPRQIKSPTFTTLMTHKGERTLHHLDLYRHEKMESSTLDWWDELTNEPGALIIVEWAEKLNTHAPQKRLDIHFEIINDNDRHISLSIHE